MDVKTLLLIILEGLSPEPPPRGSAAPCHETPRALRAARRPVGLLFVCLVLLLACGDDAPPPAGRRDAGPLPFDASTEPFDDAGIDAGRRGDELVLPPADVEIVLPYFGPEATLERRIDGRPARLDVHFSIDTTGSFGDEIDTLQSDLRNVIVPALEARVDDVAFGVSRFEDFPFAPFGAPTDSPFELLTPMTRRRSDVLTAVARLDQPLGAGGDTPESGFEALHQIATGEGLTSRGQTWIPRYTGSGVGGVGFRDGAIRAVVHVTDAPSHGPDDYGASLGAHSFADTTTALRDVGARVLGIASHPSARPDLERLARETSALVAPIDGGCPHGIDGAQVALVAGRCPLVFDVGTDGRGLTDAIVDAIVGLLDATSWSEVYGRSDDRLGFVTAIEATGATPPTGVSPPTVEDRRPTDGVDDTYLDVRSGVQLGFELRLRNTTVPPADYDQVFRVRFEIVGDTTVLDVLTVRVIVPGGRLDAGVDAGVDAGDDDAGDDDAGADDAGVDEDAG